MPEQPSRLLDLRRLPGTRESLVYRDGGLFPVLTLTPEGMPVAALRGGAGHLGLAGRIEVVRSFDGGTSWSPPAVVADSERDDRNPAFGTTRAGTLVLAYYRAGCYDDQGLWAPAQFAGRSAEVIEVMTTRSVDGGLTWERPTPSAIPQVADGSPYGKIVCVADGTLLMAIYHDQPAGGDRCESWIVRSDDDGRTWTDPTLIAAGFNETALLVLPDGEVLAVMRGDGEDDGLSVTRSSDAGRTWSPPAPLTGPHLHPADLALLADGSILVTYGNRTPPYRIEGRVSRDGGRTWLDALLVFSGHLYGYTVDAARPTDLGYPTTVIARPTGGDGPRAANGQGVTLYYYNPSHTLAGAARIQTRSPFYGQASYLAVAVTWQESELLSALAEFT